MSKICEEPPIVSVIIAHLPTTPREETLQRTLQSLRSQTYKKIQLIVELDPSRRGCTATRNIGFTKAIGKYVFFCDDDITLYPACIEKLVSVLENDPKASISYCKFVHLGLRSGIMNGHDWDVERLKKSNYISAMSMIRKSDFIGWNEELKRLDDWDMWLTMAEQGKYGIFVPEILFEAVFLPDSITVDLGAKEAEDLVKVRHGI